MLSHFLTTQIFAFLLIFCRLGSALMQLPGFGETYVAARTRLILAFFFSMALVPVVKAIPAPPDTVFGLLSVVGSEILIGLFMGALGRMMISAVHIAGTIIAYESSLSSALTLDIASFSGQDTSLGNLLSMSAVVLIFVTDLHHVMLKGLADSYTLFLPGMLPSIADMAHHATQTMSDIFKVGMQLAAPHIVVGTILYLCAGILARLMPNIQIFFVMMAPQLLLSFFILMTVFSAIMMWYLDYFRGAFGAFVSP